MKVFLAATQQLFRLEKKLRNGLEDTEILIFLGSQAALKAIATYKTVSSLELRMQGVPYDFPSQ